MALVHPAFMDKDKPIKVNNEWQNNRMEALERWKSWFHMDGEGGWREMRV